MGAHHFDITQWGLGRDGSGPVEIFPPDEKNVSLLTYLYPGGVKVYHGSSQAQPAGTSVFFVGSEGWVAVGRSMFETRPASLATMTLKGSDDPLYTSNNHHENWLDCIRSRSRPICDVEIGASSVTVCHLGNIAYRLKRPFKWDPEKKVFLGDTLANRELDRPRRAPWTL